VPFEITILVKSSSVNATRMRAVEWPATRYREEKHCFKGGSLDNARYLSSFTNKAAVKNFKSFRLYPEKQ
jgi:hypothetical protein